MLWIPTSYIFNPIYSPPSFDTSSTLSFIPPSIPSLYLSSKYISYCTLFQHVFYYSIHVHITLYSLYHLSDISNFISIISSIRQMVQTIQSNVYMMDRMLENMLEECTITYLFKKDKKLKKNSKQIEKLEL
jgi:hypothetical protein